MLLADKSANRVSRQDRRDAQHTLSLPLGVLQHYGTDVQLLVSYLCFFKQANFFHTRELKAVKELIKEARRLVGVIEHPLSDEKVFLDVPMYVSDALFVSLRT